MSKLKTNRSSARLAAVQALYEYSFGAKTIDQIAREFLNGQIGTEIIEEIDEFGAEEFIPVMPAEPSLFTGILACFGENEEQINEMISASFSEDWSKERVEQTLLAILQAGVAELMAFPSTPIAIIITEYVEIAASFYNGPEMRVTNGILDNIAKVLRDQD